MSHLTQAVLLDHDHKKVRLLHGEGGNTKLKKFLPWRERGKRLPLSSAEPSDSSTVLLNPKQVRLLEYEVDKDYEHEDELEDVRRLAIALI